MTNVSNSEPRLHQLIQRLAPHRERLMRHPIYSSVNSVDRLRAFMQSHVFAVWDFMSLLKALQRSLTCVEVPWLPPTYAGAARLINEIVLGEECDEDGQGGYASHFQLYVSSMQACAAETGTILNFCERLRGRTTIREALTDSSISSTVREFVASTFQFIEGSQPSEIAAAFTFGREDVIPDMFQQFVDTLCAASPEQFSRFRFYLERHIHLDADDHGPKAMRMIAVICGDDSDEWDKAERAAIAAINTRHRFWDGVLAELQSL